MSVNGRAAAVAAELESTLGLATVDIRYGLTQDDLFTAAVEGDLGRVRPDGPDYEHKARSTALGHGGPLVFYSDPSCTGRPVSDTYCVARPSVADDVWWKPGFARFAPDAFDALLSRVVSHLNRRRATLYVTDLYCGADPDFAEPCRFVGEYATHAYFCNIMFPPDTGAGRHDDIHDGAYRRDAAGDDGSRDGRHLDGRHLDSRRGDNRHDVCRHDGSQHDDRRRWTLLNVPSFHCDPARDGTRSERAVIADIERRTALVLGRADYCGINKKTMFTIMNFVLPSEGQLPMHCSANVGEDGDCAVLFGLSGTGKTTLSADPDRELIGDDEHVWTDSGIANFEAGCYAKLIDLDKGAEPVIAAALSMKGTLVENVPPLPGQAVEDTHPQDLDLADRSITENTRFAYPLECNPNVAPGARGPHPSTIVLLTADAFGVLPPVSLLDPDEVMYHFVTGFTSKLAGTEVGVTEPRATFSACFGSPFMSQHPHVYAGLLNDRMHQHRVRCVLLNTGWSGGPHGTGERMPLPLTRALLKAALAGRFDRADTRTHPILGLSMPVSCDGVDAAVLDPRSTWDDPWAYDDAAERLKGLFHANFEKQGYEALGIANAM